MEKYLLCNKKKKIYNYYLDAKERLTGKYACFLTAFAILFSPSYAMAADNPFTVAYNLMNSIYGQLFKISSCVAIFITGVFLLWGMCVDEHQRKAVTGRIKTVWLFWFLLNTLAGIFDIVSTNVGSNGFETLDQFKP